MVIDVHCHIGRSRDTAGTSVPQILRNMRRCHISKTVIFPIDEKNPGPSYSAANRRIARLVRKHRSFIGCIRLDPNQLPAAFDEIRWAQANGFRAVKLHPRTDRFSIKKMEPLFGEISRSGMAVILHTSHEQNCSPRDWIRFIKRCPKTFFIFAHGGKDDWKDAISVANQFKTVFLETTTQSFYRTGMILKGVGTHNVVFGSDTPYSHVDVELMKFELLLSPQKRRLVLRENAKRILGL